jgi:hypothetical protein
MAPLSSRKVMLRLQIPVFKDEIGLRRASPAPIRRDRAIGQGNSLRTDRHQRGHLPRCHSIRQVAFLIPVPYHQSLLLAVFHTIHADKISVLSPQGSIICTSRRKDDAIGHRNFSFCGNFSSLQGN